MEPSATVTFAGGADSGVMPAFCRNEELTKLVELPESNRVNMTWFFTRALSLIVVGVA
jgi:hypothetical protein